MAKRQAGGKDMSELKEAMENILSKPSSSWQDKGNGWVDYKWVNPVTKALKTNPLTQQVDDYFLGMRIYK